MRVPETGIHRENSVSRKMQEPELGKIGIEELTFGRVEANAHVHRLFSFFQHRGDALNFRGSARQPFKGIPSRL